MYLHLLRKCITWNLFPEDWMTPVKKQNAIIKSRLCLEKSGKKNLKKAILIIMLIFPWIEVTIR